MMYMNKMVAVIKVGNRVLRERDGVVYIPFGSEYSIHFENIGTATAVIDVSIDGEDVLDSASLVVKRGGVGRVEGFLKGNEVSHKFKFIEKTEQISDHRGDKVSDGLIRVSFQFEKKPPPTTHNTLTYPPGVRSGVSPTFGSSIGSMAAKSSTMDSSFKLGSMAPVDDGITVKGSQSDQAFTSTVVGPLERDEHVMVFQLKGELNDGKVVEQPLLTRTKLICDICGTKNISSNKFCSECGTSLVV